MRKDIKTGMLAGTVLCIAAIVWFCTRQEIIHRPQVIDIERQNQTSETTSVHKSAAKPHIYTPASPANIPPAAETGRIHIVEQGQTLSDISKIYYNTSSEWKKIYEANKDLFPRGPDIIKPGMKLIIPQ